MKKVISIALAAIASVMLFTACAPGETQTPQATATPTPTPTVAPTPTPQETATLSDFVIIYPQSETLVAHPLKYKADDLNMALLGSVSTMCLPLTDLIDEAQGFVENKYEILLGDTNRKESNDVIAQAGNLRKYDYVIKAVGTKIVIYAVADEGYDLAIQDFAKMCKDNNFTAENALPAIKQVDVDHFHGNSPDGFFVDGVSIGDFVLVSTLSDKDNTALLKHLLDTTGYELSTGSTGTPSAHEIIIGKVNRPQVSAVLGGIRYLDYSISFADGNIIITAHNDEALADAVERFKTDFLDTKAEKKEFTSQNDLVSNAEYPIMSLTLLGSDIAEYSILAESTSDTSATSLRDYIRDLTGWILPITTDDACQKAIVLSGADSEKMNLLIEDLAWDEYIVKSEGTRLYLGSSDTYYKQGPAVHKFLKDYVGFTPETKEVASSTVVIEDNIDILAQVEDFFMKEINDELLEDIETRANSLREKIRNSKTEIVAEGTSYYVSNDGDDNNDGLSPLTPWATLDRVNKAELTYGDVVYFNRGDIFRGHLAAIRGATYSAYGEGQKPRIYGSPFDGAVTGTWQQTDVPNVYRYSERFAGDVGLISMNNAQYHAYKICINGSYKDRGTGKPFASYKDLSEDLTFFHNLGGFVTSTQFEEYGYLYLCSTEGNPAERFDSIEFNSNGNIISATDDNTFDNLCIMYGGCHGIAAGTVNNLVVQNCEIAWIGGSLQGYDDNNNPVRFGNGVEIYGGCDNYEIKNCYIYQCYDAGVTNQTSTGSRLVMKGVKYHDNLLEYNTYNIEYFMSGTSSYIHSMEIYNNIMRYAGYGWGMQRPDHLSVNIQGWNHQNILTEDGFFNIYNNVMQYSVYHMVWTTSHVMEDGPTYTGNILIQHERGTNNQTDTFWGYADPNNLAGEHDLGIVGDCNQDHLPYEYGAAMENYFLNNEVYIVRN